MTAHDTIELLQTAEAATGAQRSVVEDQLVRRYLPMTHRIAARFAGRGADVEDLRQVANLALLKAIRGFHQDRGSFEAYVKVSVTGALKRHLRDHCWAVRPPRRVQELIAQVGQSTEEMVQADREPPAPWSLAERMDATVIDITEALTARACYTAISLDEPRGPTARPLSEKLMTDTDPYDDVVEHLTLVQLCADLTDRDRELIHLRFYQCLSQREIAREIGVSQMQVSRLLARLLDRLRQRAHDAQVA